MKNILKIILFALFGFTWLDSVNGQKSHEANNDRVEVDPKISTLCTLVKNPEQFNNKLVRVKTIFFSNYEYAGLYDPKCNGNQNVVWLDIKCDGPLEKCSVHNDLSSIPYTTLHGSKMRKVLLKGIFRYSGSDGKRFGANIRTKFALELIEIEGP